jgi:hypothetical protein
MKPCAERQKLSQAAALILDQIIAVNKLQIEALRSSNMRKLLKHDKELELLVGEKERVFGALHQHTKEHRC